MVGVSEDLNIINDSDNKGKEYVFSIFWADDENPPKDLAEARKKAVEWLDFIETSEVMKKIREGKKNGKSSN